MTERTKRVYGALLGAGWGGLAWWAASWVFLVLATKGRDMAIQGAIMGMLVGALCGWALARRPRPPLRSALLVAAWGMGLVAALQGLGPVLEGNVFRSGGFGPYARGLWEFAVLYAGLCSAVHWAGAHPLSQWLDRRHQEIVAAERERAGRTTHRDTDGTWEL